MASPNSSRYHLLPDPRASIDSNDDENARLIDATEDNTTPKKVKRGVTFHPTVITRLIALVFTFASFMTFIFVGGSDDSPAIVFLSFTIARQLFVLLSHLIGKFVQIHIEINNAALKRTSIVKKADNLRSGAVPLIMDACIIIGLIISLSFGLLGRALAAAIVGFIGL
jgi:hypothetical protein